MVPRLLCFSSLPGPLSPRTRVPAAGEASAPRQPSAAPLPQPQAARRCAPQTAQMSQTPHQRHAARPRRSSQTQPGLRARWSAPAHTRV
eukprot:225010-Chlamydomonas_euryale.AAC.1